MPIHDFNHIPKEKQRTACPKINLVGYRYGNLTVTRFTTRVGNHYYWECLCDCGNTTILRSNSLRTGRSRSCGCLAAPHGKHKTIDYRSWNTMRQRVLNKRAPDYYRYGGRGVRICERWSSAANFFADMGPRPSIEYTLDRIDNKGHYSCGKCTDCIRNGWPPNCKWSNREEQQNNRRNTVHITAFGQTLSLTEWARRCGLPPNTIRSRIKAGWLAEDAVNKPRQK